MIAWLFLGAVAAMVAGGVAIGTRHVRMHVGLMVLSQLLLFAAVIASWSRNESTAQRNHVSVGMTGLALLLLQTLTGSFFSSNATVARLHAVTAVVIVCIAIHQTASGLFVMADARYARQIILGLLELAEICGAVWLARRSHQRVRVQPYLDVRTSRWIKWPVGMSIALAFTTAAVAAHATLVRTDSQLYIASLMMFYAAEITWIFLPLRQCIPRGKDFEVPVLLIAALAWCSVVNAAVGIGLPTWCLYLHIPMLWNVWLVDIAVYIALP